VKPATLKTTPAVAELGSRCSHTRPSPYVSAVKTKSLLASGTAGRIERLQAGDMVTTREAARIAGTTDVTINDWIAKGRAIGLGLTRSRRGYRMPKWQFELGIWTVLPELAQVMGTTEGWALLSFLESPLGGLNGRTPRQAIEQGEALRVLQLASVEGDWY